VSGAATRKPAAAGSARPNRGDAPDRAAAVRAALRALVAERGFHGASMGAVAREAGVATGTAYVHYASKDELVLAAFLETKQQLGEAAVAAGGEEDLSPAERFCAIWKGIYRFFAAKPEDARFLIQVEGSPYGQLAHEAAMAREDDPLVAAAAAPDIAGMLEPLPLQVLYEIGLAPAVRLAARGIELGEGDLERTARACWRAVSADR